MERVNNDSLNFELMDLQIDCEKAKEIAADLSGYCRFVKHIGQ